jgi:hypothetical protein
MSTPFIPFDKFTHNGREWAAGEFSNKVNGYAEQFVPVLHDVEGKVNYGLRPTIVDGQVTEVELTTTPQQDGASIETLDATLREKFAKTLEWSAKRAGVRVDEDLLQAVKDGRNLAAERGTQADFDRMTRNLDHDLEAAYMLRDALREEANTALDEGRDADAKAAMERLGEVKQSIQDYWNPHKERPAVVRDLSPKQEEEVELMRMVMESDLEQDAAKLAAAHFGVEAQEASQRGDTKAASQATDKAKTYAERVRAGKETQASEKQGFAARESERGQNGSASIER